MPSQESLASCLACCSMNEMTALNSKVAQHIGIIASHLDWQLLNQTLPLSKATPEGQADQRTLQILQLYNLFTSTHLEINNKSTNRCAALATTETFGNKHQKLAKLSPKDTVAIPKPHNCRLFAEATSFSAGNGERSSSSPVLSSSWA